MTRKREAMKWHRQLQGWTAQSHVGQWHVIALYRGAVHQKTCYRLARRTSGSDQSWNQSFKTAKAAKEAAQQIEDDERNNS